MKNIWAFGATYPHAGLTKPAEPLIFLKAGSTLVEAGHPIHLVAGLGPICHEVEIALRFGPTLQFDAYTIALDLTAKERQDEFRKLGRPWTMSKSFKNATPIGSWQELNPGSLNEGFGFELKRNGVVVQHGHTRQMDFEIELLRQMLLRYFPVEPGDILLTGTPDCVGPIASGDVLLLSILSPMTYSVTFDVA